jgi:hypothetical protein
VCCIPHLSHGLLGLFSPVSPPKHPQTGSKQSSIGVTSQVRLQTGQVLMPALAIIESTPLKCPKQTHEKWW